MQTLTKRQQQILDMIRDHIDETGVPPTRADICDYFNFRSPTAADDHLKALARKQVIELMPGTSRGIRLLGAHQENALPVVGFVAAGAPIMAEEHIEDYFAIDPALFYPRADYLLRVRGDSMINVGIFDNDLLAVHSTTRVHNNQIVVARIEDEVTVKRFRQRGNIVTLFPENDDYEPIRVDLREKEFSIEGIYTGVLRFDE